MKKIILSLFVLSITFLAFSSDVNELLKAAQGAYELGDFSTALQNIDSAKLIIEREKLSSASEEYIELNSWDIVKLKKSEYLGKKVKFRTKFIAITYDGNISLTNITPSNTYNESLIDKILTLKKFEFYTFYGTVIDDTISPKLHIEAIE